MKFSLFVYGVQTSYARGLSSYLRFWRAVKWRTLAWFILGLCLGAMIMDIVIIFWNLYLINTLGN
jgi:hypothetical protein